MARPIPSSESKAEEADLRSPATRDLSLKQKTGEEIFSTTPFSDHTPCVLTLALQYDKFNIFNFNICGINRSFPTPTGEVFNNPWCRIEDKKQFLQRVSSQFSRLLSSSILKRDTVFNLQEFDYRDEKLMSAIFSSPIYGLPCPLPLLVLTPDSFARERKKCKNNVILYNPTFLRLEKCYTAFSYQEEGRRHPMDYALIAEFSTSSRQRIINVNVHAPYDRPRELFEFCLNLASNPSYAESVINISGDMNCSPSEFAKLCEGTGLQVVFSKALHGTSIEAEGGISARGKDAKMEVKMSDFTILINRAKGKILRCDAMMYGFSERLDMRADFREFTVKPPSTLDPSAREFRPKLPSSSAARLDPTISSAPAPRIEPRDQASALAPPERSLVRK